MPIEVVHTVTDELLEAMQRLMPQLNPGHPIPDRQALERIVRSEASTMLISRDDSGKITGMLTLVVFHTPSGTHAWIEDVVVDAASRGQGIGEALTRTALDMAQEQGADSVNLTSRPAREAANRLYQRVGFQLRQTNVYRYSLPRK